MKKQSFEKKRVFVGLSGGVDSAVSAALLKKEGFNVTGVFIKAWQPFDSFDKAQDKSAQGTRRFLCEWKEDRRSAMRVAAILDIPFLTLDLEKEYKKEVVDYMIEEYKKGRTPNPDVMCNKEIKFGYFLKFALKNGADFVATGHYAQKNELRSMNYELREGKDKNKDQSYFLWTLTQDQLKHILFPVGNMRKNEVRELAKRFGLPQAIRKDSQGLCFLGKIDMKEFLSHYLPQKKGDVLLAPRSFLGQRSFSEVGGEVGIENEEIIGHHNGALFFTIGERHGFTITKKTEREKPLYVISKDIERNTISVASKQSARSGQMLTKEVFLSKINLIYPVSLKLLETKEKLTCRIRYRGEKIPCKFENGKVILGKKEMGISTGQSLVFYSGETCLGGGIIDSIN